MNFKYYAFELLPYGAVLEITCTSSSKSVYKIANYYNNKSFSIQSNELGKGYSYFVESSIEPVEMNYTYRSINGRIVSISTNLTIKNLNIGEDIQEGSFTLSNEERFNLPYPSIIVTATGETSITINDLILDRGIIKCTQVDDGTKLLYEKSSSTLYNNIRFYKIINNVKSYYTGQVKIEYEKEPIFIKICCNGVKIENCFVNLGQGERSENGFNSLGYTEDYLTPSYSYYDKVYNYTITYDKAYFKRYITIHWDKPQVEPLFYGTSKEEEEIFGRLQVYAIGIKDPEKTNNQGYEYESILDINRTRKFTSYDDPKFTITIPALKNDIYKSYKFGYTVNFEGCSTWIPAYNSFIQQRGNLLTYDKDGYLKGFVDAGATKRYFETNIITGLPIIYNLKSWGNNKSFYKLKSSNQEELYVSPSDRINLFTEWETFYKLKYYYIEFDPNEGEMGGHTNDKIYQTIKLDTTENLKLNRYINYGKQFVYWTLNRIESNGDRVFPDGASVNNLTEANATIVLYAQWVPIQNWPTSGSYNIIYHDNCRDNKEKTYKQKVYYNMSNNNIVDYIKKAEDIGITPLNSNEEELEYWSPYRDDTGEGPYFYEEDPIYYKKPLGNGEDFNLYAIWQEIPHCQDQIGCPSDQGCQDEQQIPIGIKITSVIEVSVIDYDGDGKLYKAWLSSGTYISQISFYDNYTKFIYNGTLTGSSDGSVINTKQFDVWYGNVGGSVELIYE